MFQDTLLNPVKGFIGCVSAIWENLLLTWASTGRGVEHMAQESSAGEAMAMGFRHVQYWGVAPKARSGP